MTDATATLLGLLVEEHHVWGIEELARELGDHAAARDAVAELHRDGLLNRIDGRSVCVSRAALRAGQILGGGA